MMECESGGTTPDKVFVLLAFEWKEETNENPLPSRLWRDPWFLPPYKSGTSAVYNRLTGTLQTLSELQVYIECRMSRNDNHKL